MINRLLHLFIPMIFVVSSLKAQVGFEQYYFARHNAISVPMSIVNYESEKRLYVEARHNYEAANTLSIYLGKSFSNDGKVKYSIAPIAGALFGKSRGGSIGVNAIVECGKLYFSTQAQYTFLRNERKADFYYAWSELEYQPCKWMYFGLSTQHTYMPQAKSWTSEPGVVLGFTVGRWTFPIYGFNSMRDDRYFIVGINFHGAQFKKTDND